MVVVGGSVVVVGGSVVVVGGSVVVVVGASVVVVLGSGSTGMTNPARFSAAACGTMAPGAVLQSSTTRITSTPVRSQPMPKTERWRTHTL